MTACSSGSPTSSSNATSNAESPTPTLTTTYHNAPLQTGTPTDADPLTASPTSSSLSTDSPSGLNYIGTFTDVSPGTSVSTKISVGQPTPNTQATPPTDVLDACNWNYTTSIAQSVYIHGSLTIHYTGSIAESVIINTPSILNLANQLQFGAGLGGGLGIQGPDGTWNGCGNSASWSYAMQPNSSVTADMWIEYPVLSNTHPSFEASDQQPLAITFAAAAADPNGSTTNTITATGPGAAECAIDGGTPTPTLLLYSTPPYNLQSRDSTGINHSDSCVTA